MISGIFALARKTRTLKAVTVGRKPKFSYAGSRIDLSGKTRGKVVVTQPSCCDIPTRMGSNPQHIYASNLLRQQSFGYPLRNPRPKDKFDPEGFRIGDVGHVDGNGKFNLVLNICSPPKELEGQIPSFHLVQPVGEPAFKPKKVLMAGVKRILKEPRYRYISIVVS